jgi:hypothetical protein
VEALMTGLTRAPDTTRRTDMTTLRRQSAPTHRVTIDVYVPGELVEDMRAREFHMMDAEDGPSELAAARVALRALDDHGMTDAKTVAVESL